MTSTLPQQRNSTALIERAGLCVVAQAHEAQLAVYAADRKDAAARAHQHHQNPIRFVH